MIFYLFFAGKNFMESFAKNSFPLFGRYASAKAKTKEKNSQGSGSLLCCKKRRVHKSCLGLCVTKTGNARDFEVVVGKCDIHLKDIKNCLTNAIGNWILKLVDLFRILA